MSLVVDNICVALMKYRGLVHYDASQEKELDVAINVASIALDISEPTIRGYMEHLIELAAESILLINPQVWSKLGLDLAAGLKRVKNE